MPNYDFLLEHRLKELNSEFAYRHTCCMSLFEQMLKKFLAVFPTFTDHTLLHTLSVTNISNQLLRENVRKLNASEIYIYLMACALHDIGMGVSDKDIDAFIDASGLRGYVNDHPEISKPNLIRKFHNDFSSQFVKKYWELLEIPSEQYANAIAEVGRGHRKTDLMDEAQNKKTNFGSSFYLSKTEGLGMASIRTANCMELRLVRVWHQPTGCILRFPSFLIPYNAPH